MQERQSPEVGTARLLTSQQVQDLLGVDASTVYRMAADGRLPAVKIGRQWRFRADRISALLDDETGPIPTVTPPAAAVTTTPGSGAPGSSAPAAAAPSPSRLRTEIAQPVVDAAADLLGVMMVVTDMAGRPVTHVANPCPRFAAHATDPDVITACAEEWRELAEDLDFEPRFAEGHLGFECARAFVRSGSELVGMVLVGGVAPDPERGDDDLFRLTPDRRTEVLASLRKVAVTLSRVATTDSRDDASVASPAI